MRFTSIVVFLFGIAWTPSIAYGTECPRPCSFGEVCCDGACANLRADISNCGACGNVCAEKNAVCDNGCCRTGPLHLPESCDSQDPPDQKLTVPDTGSVSVAMKSYGGTPCSDHLVIQLLTPKFQFGEAWESIVVTAQGVVATSACDCADYQMHVRVEAPGIMGGFCYGSEACASCGNDASCCQRAGGCFFEPLHGINKVERRVNGSWNGAWCWLQTTINRDDGFDGALGQVHASVMRKSTGEKFPLLLRVFGD